MMHRMLMHTFCSPQVARLCPRQCTSLLQRKVDYYRSFSDNSCSKSWGQQQRRCVHQGFAMKAPMTPSTMPLDTDSHANSLRHSIVDSLPSLEVMLADLQSKSQLSIDAEGLNLSRDGKLCILVVATSDAAVYIVDVSKLGLDAFGHSASGASLAAILESEAVEKLFWDPRMDCDALFHQFGVKTANVLDLQVAEVAYRRHVRRAKVRFVVGLGRALDEYVPLFTRTAGPMVDKRMVGRMMDADPQFWDRRPLSDTQVTYCAQDVVHLFALRRTLMQRLTASIAAKVKKVSAMRALDCTNPLNPNLQTDRALAPML